MSTEPQLSGLLHKKRGGFGKIMPNSWQYRYFTVSKVIHIYFIITIIIIIIIIIIINVYI